MANTWKALILHEKLHEWDYVVSFLQSENYQVIVAEDYRQFENLIKKDFFEILLVDSNALPSVKNLFEFQQKFSDSCVVFLDHIPHKQISSSQCERCKIKVKLQRCMKEILSRSGQKVRILVVDDEPNIIKVLCHVLSDRYIVDSASSVREAIKKISEQNYQIMLLDFQMQEMSGLELAQIIKNLQPDLAIILMTGYSTKEIAIKALKVGIKDFLEKPLTPKTTIKSIENVWQNIRVESGKKTLMEQIGKLSFSCQKELSYATKAALNYLIKTRNFYYHYQPIIDAKNSKIFGYEALFRSKDNFFNNPEQMINKAIKHSCLNALSLAMRNTGLMAFHYLDDEQKLFVNIHPKELNNDLLLWSQKCEKKQQIVFEITEAGKIEDYQKFSELIAELKKQGFSIALDDLGAGYSSLNSLLRLDPDFIKLDMAIIQGVCLDNRNARLVKSLSEFAAGEGIQVIAEGIETEEQREIVIGLGCNFLQGYLLGRPAPLYKL